MKKILIFIFLLFSTNVFAADQELDDLTTKSPVVAGDRVYIRSDSGNGDQKVYVSTLLNSGVGSLTGLADVGSATLTTGNILVADGAKFQSVTMGGSCTITSSGSISCSSGGGGSGASQLTGLSDVGSATATSGRLLVADGTKYQAVAMSGSCTITNAGVITCPNASGATQLTGLSDVGSATATAGRLMIADGTKFQSVAITGDITISSTGVSAVTGGGDGLNISGTSVGEIRFLELSSNGIEYSGFKAADSISTNHIWVLPSADLTNGVMKSDGSHTLSMAAMSLTGLSDIGTSTKTAGNLLIADGTKFQSVAMSSSCTITSAGVISCAGGGGTGATQLTGLSDVGSATATAGRLLISDGTKFQSKALTGDATITSAGVIDLGSAVVGSTELASTTVSAGSYSGIGVTVDADGRLTNIFSSGLTGLTDVGSATITSGRLLIADGTKFQSVAMGTDATIDNTGALQIASAVVGAAELSSLGTAGTFFNMSVDADGRVTNAFSMGLTGLNDVGTATITAGRLLVADGTKFQSVGMSGSCTITSAGAISCPSASGATQLTGLSDVGSATIAAGTLLIADGTKYQAKSMSGDATITSAGVIDLGSAVVGANELSSLGTAGTYVHMSVDADGRVTNAFAVGLTGLNDVGSATITSGRLLIADGTKYQAVVMSGDGTLASSGDFQIASAVVGATELSSLGTAGTTGAATISVDPDGRVTNAFASGLTGLTDIGSATITAGRLLIADGTKFQSVSAGGDCTINSNGVLVCARRGCVTNIGLTATDDHFPLTSFATGATAAKYWVKCAGTCSTMAQVTFEDGSQNAAYVNANFATSVTVGATANFATAQTGNTFTAGEVVQYNVTNSPTASDNYVICGEFWE